MSCKYPKDSRSYKFCIGCSDKNYCVDSSIPKIQMDILPSASQANQMTKENIANKILQDLAEILDKIKKAIADGEFSISGEGNLKHETVESLKKLGYKVETECYRNESYWSISWK